MICGRPFSAADVVARTGLARQRVYDVLSAFSRRHDSPVKRVAPGRYVYRTTEKQ